MMDIIVVVSAASYTWGGEAALRTRTLQMTNIVSVIAVSLCRIPRQGRNYGSRGSRHASALYLFEPHFPGFNMLGCEKLFLDTLGYGDCCAASLGHCRKPTSSFNSCAEAQCKGAKAEQGANA
jgi:hypothetical protein